MNITSPISTGHVRVTLSSNELLHVLHSKSIIAYQGRPQSREDRMMDFGGIYRKKKWVRSRLEGPCEFLLGWPAGFSLETIEIPQSSNLLFDFRHVAFFTDGVSYKSKLLKLKTAWITRDLVRMKFSGPGKLGVMTVGDMATVQLDPHVPLFVDSDALIAYPEEASIKLSVYGNTLASQHMKVQWELRGEGPVLIQTGFRDAVLEEKINNDGWLKRILREVLPFGSVYIK